MTIQSNRPSSRSSQRSTGSIGSYGRRSSGALPSKGVNVSQSRQGSARSAAILLYSYQLNELKNSTQRQNSMSSSKRSHSDEFMAKYIEQQLEQQKKLLYLEIPALRNHNSLMRKLRLNPRSECDLTQLEAQYLNRDTKSKKLRLIFFKQQPTTTTEFNNAVMGVDERSDDANMCLNGETKGFINPMAYSLNDLDDDDDDEDDSEDDEKHRKYIIDNEEIFIGALPSPASEGPSIAVMIDRCEFVHMIYML